MSAKKSNLPIEVHHHFRKANILHTYVQKDLGEASKHALETGQELLAAKAAIPHGRWEDECERLFDGSLRTAQFYMQFTKDFSRLKSAQKCALLMLEGTLDGAAKAAKKAAKPPAAQKPPPPPDSDPFDVDPFDAPELPVEAPEAMGATETPQPPKGRQRGRGGTQKGKDGKPPKQFDRSHWFKQWDQQIGPLVRVVDKIAEGVGEKHGPGHKAVHAALETATEEIMQWMRVKK